MDAVKLIGVLLAAMVVLEGLLQLFDRLKHLHRSSRALRTRIVTYCVFALCICVIVYVQRRTIVDPERGRSDEGATATVGTTSTSVMSAPATAAPGTESPTQSAST